MGPRIGHAKIRRLRHKLELTQKDFSRFLGVSRLSVVRWESGKQVPELSMRQKLREMLLRYEVS